MDFLADSHGAAASLGVILGAIITKILTNSQKIKEIKLDEASQIRKELKERCEKLEVENDLWKNKFYVQTTELKEQIMALTAHIKALEAKLDDVAVRYNIKL